MGDWRSISLADVVTLQRGHDLPTAARGKGIVPVIGSFGITGYHDVARYSGPGVAIGRSGASIGVATFCPKDYWPLNTCLFVRDFKANDPRWVYYLLDSIDFSSFNSGSAQPSLNRNYLANIEVDLPPPDEQRGIAATLGALDDKIESSQRARATIRQLGEAKVAESLAVSEPNPAMLTDLTSSISRGVTPKYADGDPDAPLVLNQKCVRGGWVSIKPARRMVERVVVAAKKVGSGDILVNSTGTGTLGRVGRWHDGDIFADSHLSIVKPNVGVVGPTTLAYALFNRESDIEAMAIGSTGQTELNPTRLGELRVPIPPNNVAAPLEAELLAFENRIARFQSEESRLVALRDALLPELLAGRICVSEAETMTAEAIA